MTGGAELPGPHNALIDVAGIRVGHHTAVGDGYLTGTTVVLAPEGGMVAGVDVRGGGPGTRETDLLHPTASVERVHALVLTGGSAFGLVACDGVMTALVDRGIGLPVGPNPGEVVPLVPGAVLFDLGRGGNFRAVPTAEFGAAALQAALAAPIPTPEPIPGQVAPGAELGVVGAGTGAATRNLKGGVGTASLILADGSTVAALVAVNAAGSPIDPTSGELLGARMLLPADGPIPATPGPAGRESLREITTPSGPGISFRPTDDPDAEVIRNTTLAVIATDAELTKAQCTKMAAVAQNGMARALNPVHTMFDGDVVFGVSTATGGRPDAIAFHEITVAAADVLTRAIVRGLLAATSTSTPAGSWPSWSDVAAG